MQKKKAISLIVLVITIIVMIILAGAIIITLSNNGIINNASDAVEKSDAATVNQIAQLGWAEAYAENETSGNKVTGEDLVAKLETGVTNALKDNKVNLEEYGIEVTTSGVRIVKGWIQIGLFVEKGNYADEENKRQKIEIGSNIAYDETVEDAANVDWQVLGASDEGELLILSTDTGVNLYFENYNPNEAIKELNDFCESYGKGRNATGARSVKVEDIDKITGFDKTKYGIGELCEYGTKVEFSYNGTNYPSYAINGKSVELKDEHISGFHYYNEEGVVTADLSSKTSGIITTITNTGYSYQPDELEIFNGETAKVVYNMLFESGDYWLASPFAEVGPDKVNFGLFRVENEVVCSTIFARRVENGNVEVGDFYSLFTSTGIMGSTYDFAANVRVVVSLDAKTNIIDPSADVLEY